eukprot:m.13402 g.13402  ORF g.13402 m.13402 type:complete len:840 (+) comp10153_c0_seq1:273-2792(+)
MLRYHSSHSKSQACDSKLVNVRLTCDVQSAAVCLANVDSSISQSLGKLAVGGASTTQYSLVNPTEAIQHVSISHTGGEAVCVEPSAAILPPHGALPLDLIVTPQREGREHVTLLAQVLDEEGDPTASCKLLEASYQGVRPKLCVTDLASNQLSSSELWERLSIAQLNASLNTLPNQLPTQMRFDLQIGTQPCLAEDSVVVLQFTNQADCPCNWHVALPNDLHWTPETWAQIQEPSPEEATQQFVLDKALFKVSPKAGTIAAHGTMQLKLQYSHQVVDDHEVPLLLHMERCQADLVLMLQGTTIPGGNGMLTLPTNPHVFEPVCLGQLTTPVQHLTLRNPSDVSVPFRLDLTEVELLRARNHQFPLMECGMPEGVVPPQGSVLVPWKLQPLQAMTYQVTVELSAADQPPQAIKLLVEGIDPRLVPEAPTATASASIAEDDDDLYTTHKLSTAPPSIPQAVLPKAFGRLSCSRWVVGEVPLFSLSRSVVFVSNTHAEDVMRFDWQFGDHATVLHAEPTSGLVSPGEVVACKLTFTANTGAKIYQIDVHCECSNYSAQQRTQTQQVESVTKQQELSQQFTYTDKLRLGKGRAGGLRKPRKGEVVASESMTALDGTINTSQFPQKVLDAGTAPSLSRTLSKSMAERPNSGGPKLQPVVGPKSVAVSDMDLRTAKYQALPPIELCPDQDLPVIEASEPSHSLYLTVSAHVRLSVDLDMEALHSSYVDRSMFKPDLTRRHTMAARDDHEYSAMATLLSGLLREVLSDPSFIHGIAQLDEEPVPVYGALVKGLQEETITPQMEALNTARDVPAALHTTEGILDETLSNLLLELLEDGALDASMGCA